MLLKSEPLTLETKLLPLYKESVASVAFFTEHIKAHAGPRDLSDAVEFCTETLLMMGVGRGAGKE